MLSWECTTRTKYPVERFCTRGQRPNTQFQEVWSRRLCKKTLSGEDGRCCVSQRKVICKYGGVSEVCSLVTRDGCSSCRMSTGLVPDFPYHSKFRGLWMSSLSSTVARKLCFHLCVYHRMPGQCSTNVCWIKWWMNRLIHKNGTGGNGPDRDDKEKGVKAERSLSLYLKKRIL